MGLFSNLFKPGLENPDLDDTFAGPGSDAGIEEAADLADLVAMKSGPAPAPPAADETPLPCGAQEHLLLQSIMSNLPDSIFFKDLKSRFISVNSTFARRHFSEDDPTKAVGKTDFDLFSQEHARKAYEDEQQIICTGKPLIGMEEKLTWSDGRVTWGVTSKFPLRGSDGTVIGTWGMSRDITDRKHTEEELTTSQEQLRHAQKMEAFGQLAGGIAHDFNNMLGVIIGSAQLMEMEAAGMSKEFRNHLNLLLDAAKRAADLTGQLLAFARKGHYKVVTLDMHEVIRSVVGLVSRTFDKRIRIAERLNGRSSAVNGDYAGLQNMLLNLALNARDAMPDGGTLTIETETVGPAEEPTLASGGRVMPGSFLRIRVTDSGLGMDEAVRARAFEPFFTTKGQGKGTGLGLASVYGTVKSHNGIIELESAVNRGTTFTIFLPLAMKPETAPVTEKSAAGRGKGKILLVDDEEDIRAVLQDILKTMGYSVAACKDGPEAIEYYHAHGNETDAVIVDMIMPRMSGYDCILALKKINPRAKILISSGYNILSDTQKLITKGIAGFIQKPYHIEELSRTLTEILVR